MKDYKKIVKYNQPSKYIVDNWREFALSLRSFGISPQEAYDIIINNKRQYNARFYWTMTRIAFYVIERIKEWEDKVQETFTTPKMKVKGINFMDFSYSAKVSIFKKLGYRLLKKSREERERVAKRIYIQKLSKKIDTCRKVVDSNEFKKEFKNFYPLEKFDARKEVQNLNKLITEKRHEDKLLGGNIDIAVNKAMKKHAHYSSERMDEYLDRGFIRDHIL